MATKNKSKIRNGNEDRDEHPRVTQKNSGEQMTQQHMKEETDINNIVNKYMETGHLGDPAATRQPIFGDFSSIDFHTMQNRIADIQMEFDSLPAKIRNKFDNDPYQLIRFVENPQNREQAIKMGLIASPAPVEPDQQDLVEQSKKEPVKAPEPPKKEAAPSTT